MTSTWTDEDRIREDEKGHEQLLRRVNTAIAKLEQDRFEAAKAGATGWPVYSPEERQQRESVAASEFDAAIAAEEEGLNGQIARWERETETLAAAQQNPLSRLDTESLSRASAMRSFVEADVRRLIARDLVDQVEAIAAAGDRGTMAAWHHAIIGRMGEVEVAEQRALLQAAADTLAERLQDTALAKKQKAAAKRLELARAARQNLWDAVRPVRVQQMRAQMASSGAYAQL
jgi:hypothetical protein